MWSQQSYGSLKRGQLLYIRDIIFCEKQCQQMYIKFWKLNVKNRCVCLAYCKLICCKNALRRCKNAINMLRKCPNFTMHILIIISSSIIIIIIAMMLINITVTGVLEKSSLGGRVPSKEFEQSCLPLFAFPTRTISKMEFFNLVIVFIITNIFEQEQFTVLISWSFDFVSFSFFICLNPINVTTIWCWRTTLILSFGII